MTNASSRRAQLTSYHLGPLHANVAHQPISAFRVPKRVATNVLAYPERQLLSRLCEVMPAWVTPDHLTGLGMIGAAMTALGYIASNGHPGFFFLASFGLVVNWFGDSLDGSLARYRKVERPRYGFFIDNSVDVINEFIIIGGLGLSPYINMSAALFALSGYFALSLYVFLAHQTYGEHRLSFANLGPTELRLAIIMFNLVMFLVGPAQFSIMGVYVPLYTAFVGLAGAGLVVIFVTNVFTTARELAHQRHNEADQREDVENASTLSPREAY